MLTITSLQPAAAQCAARLPAAVGTSGASAYVGGRPPSWQAPPPSCPDCPACNGKPDCPVPSLTLSPPLHLFASCRPQVQRRLCRQRQRGRQRRRGGSQGLPGCQGVKRYTLCCTRPHACCASHLYHSVRPGVRCCVRSTAGPDGPLPHAAHQILLPPTQKPPSNNSSTAFSSADPSSFWLHAPWPKRPNTHLSCFCTSLPMLAAPLHPFCYTRLCTAAPSRRPLFISTKPAVPTPSPPLIPLVNTPRGMRRPHRPFAFPNNAAAFVTVHLNDAH